MILRGWQEHDPASGDDNRPVKCGSCDWEGLESEVFQRLYNCENLFERLDPGSVVPVGECPYLHEDEDWEENESPRRTVCRSLVYYADVEIIYRRTPTVLDLIVEAVEAAD